MVKSDNDYQLPGLNDVSPEVQPTRASRRAWGDALEEVARPLVGVLVFLGCWIYAVMSFGWFWGLGVGWLPSAFFAVLAAVAWRFVLLLAAIAALEIWRR